MRFMQKGAEIKYYDGDVTNSANHAWQNHKMCHGLVSHSADIGRHRSSAAQTAGCDES